MRFVLKDPDGDYFAGMGHDSFRCVTAMTTADINLAVVFRMLVSDGEPVIEPELPDRDEWWPVAVSVSLTFEE